MEVSTLKWVLAISLFSLAFLGGIAPIRFKKKDRDGRYLALGNMLSGGIFLGGGLMHLLPEAHEGLEETTKDLDSFLATFPCAYFLAAVGFFTILAVEEIVLASTHGDKASSSSSSGDNLTNSPSSRNSISYPSSPSMSRHGNHTHIPYTPPAGQVTNEERNRSFLKLYFTKRTIARSIVQSLTPRSVLVPADSRSALRDAPVMAPSTPVHRHRHLDVPSSQPRPSIIKPSSRSLISYSAPQQQPLLNDENAIVDVTSDVSLDTHTHPHGEESDTEQDTDETTSSDQHGHGHGNGKDDDHDHFNLDSSSTVVAYLLVLALSFHSIFEGIALGTQESYADTVSLFIAIAAHTPLAGFALGVSLVKAKATTRMHLSCIALFSCMTPFGAVAGLLMSYFLKGSVLTGVSAGFQAFSAGTFLFVALEEIIPKELANPRDKMAKLGLCMLGFAGMAAIKIFDK